MLIPFLPCSVVPAQATVYRNCSKDDPHVVLFWRMMREKFSDEDRAKFLTFTWGRSRLPTQLADFDDKFQ